MECVADTILKEEKTIFLFLCWGHEGRIKQSKFFFFFHTLHTQIVTMRSFVQCTFTSGVIPCQNPLSSEHSIVSFSSIEFS